MSQSLIIKNGKFTARLYEVTGLLELPLANIRKLWKLMFDEVWSNEETIATIESWLPQALKETHAYQQQLEASMIATKAEAEAKRRAMVALGTTLDMKIAQAKRLLKTAKGQEAIARARVFLYDAMKPKTEYQQAVKAVKALETTIKAGKRNQDRLEKLQTIFNEMRR